jgi:hypothetical protein
MRTSPKPRLSSKSWPGHATLDAHEFSVKAIVEGGG